MPPSGGLLWLLAAGLFAGSAAAPGRLRGSSAAPGRPVPSRYTGAARRSVPADAPMGLLQVASRSARAYGFPNYMSAPSAGGMAMPDAHLGVYPGLPGVQAPMQYSAFPGYQHEVYPGGGRLTALPYHLYKGLDLHGLLQRSGMNPKNLEGMSEPKEPNGWRAAKTTNTATTTGADAEQMANYYTAMQYASAAHGPQFAQLYAPPGATPASGTAVPQVVYGSGGMSPVPGGIVPAMAGGVSTAPAFGVAAHPPVVDGVTNTVGYPHPHHLGAPGGAVASMGQYTGAMPPEAHSASQNPIVISHVTYYR